MLAFLFATSFIVAQTPRCTELERKIYALNNEFKYEESQQFIHDFLDIHDLTNGERFHAYVILSYTYKRLFNYTDVERMLDSALLYGKLETDSTYYLNNANCQKALMYFDIHKYSQADSLMRQLSQSGYAHINTEYQAKLLMQEAYLEYLRKQFAIAQAKYQQSLLMMGASSPCDKPMIYGKLIELYGATKNKRKLFETYNIALACADSCSIYKYRLYITEMMAKSLSDMGSHKESAELYKVYIQQYDSYQSTDQSRNLMVLENKFQLNRKEQEIQTTKQQLKERQLLTYLLVLIVIAVSLVTIIVYMWQRRNLLQREKEQSTLFTKELFHQTENERKRIASDLHDGVGSDLVLIKNGIPDTLPEIKQSITNCIDNIRQISRNLHPVLFDKVGFIASVEQLIERVQNVHQLPIALVLQQTKELPTSVAIQLYRIIQESLNNVVKHSKAIAAKVELSDSREGIFLQITDNGIGFDTEIVFADAKPFGILSITERANAIGAKSTIQSNEKGTIVTVKVPNI